MKRKILYLKFLGLLGVSLFFVFFASCSFSLRDIYQDPQVSVSSFEVKKVTEEVIHGQVWLNIYNPNVYSFEVKLDKCLAFLNGNNIGEFFMEKYTELSSEKSIDLPVEVMVPQAGIITGIVSGLLASFLGNDQTEITITLQGAVMIKKFGIPFKRSFEIDHQVDPLAQLKKWIFVS